MFGSPFSLGRQRSVREVYRPLVVSRDDLPGRTDGRYRAADAVDLHYLVVGVKGVDVVVDLPLQFIDRPLVRVDGSLNRLLLRLGRCPLLLTVQVLNVVY